MKRGVIVKMATLHIGTAHPGRYSLAQAKLLGPEKHWQRSEWVFGQDFHLVVVDENSFVEQALLLCSHHKVMSLILTSVK